MDSLAILNPLLRIDTLELKQATPAAIEQKEGKFITLYITYSLF